MGSQVRKASADPLKKCQYGRLEEINVKHTSNIEASNNNQLMFHIRCFGNDIVGHVFHHLGILNAASYSSLVVFTPSTRAHSPQSSSNYCPLGTNK